VIFCFVCFKSDVEIHHQHWKEEEETLLPIHLFFASSTTPRGFILESMVKENVKNGSPTIEKWLKV
jgi:hypothetical protein